MGTRFDLEYALPRITLIVASLWAQHKTDIYLCMQRGMQSYVVVTRLFPALGIRKECDGGTEWERVEVGDCPLTLPTQDVQVRPFQVVYFCFWS